MTPTLHAFLSVVMHHFFDFWGAHLGALRESKLR